MINMGFVYKITNKVNNKVYIGKTEKNILWRWEAHLKGAKKHYNRHLYDAMNHYGYENFTIEEIERCSASILNEREKYWIKFYKSQNPLYGYNRTDGGSGGNTWRLNTHKELTSTKLSHSIKNSVKHKESHNTKEYKDKMSKIHKGKKMSKEACLKISKSTKKRFENIKEREKLRKAHLGKKLTEEHKKNIGLAVKGRKLSQKHKDKIGKANKGKRKGKTWEEIYGIEKATKLKERKSKQMMGHVNFRKKNKDIWFGDETKDFRNKVLSTGRCRKCTIYDLELCEVIKCQ